LSNHRTTEFEVARDELFSHIHRCGVMKAADDQRAEWLADTIGYIGERHPTLTKEDLDELQEIGARFCRPAIPHGPEHTALSTPARPAGDQVADGAGGAESAREDDGESGSAEEQELAGAI
jgi:hypothetical protein